MELNIYNQSGELKLTASVTSSSTWNLELMRENALSLTFTIPVCVSLQVNDYIILEGVRFSVKKEYKPRKKNSQKYSYSVKFYAPIHDAQQVVYLHLTDGQYEPQFSLDGSPREHLQKWVDNMNRIYGEERWRIGDVIDAPNQNIEYSNTTCWDALASMAEIFSTEWWSDGFYINLCRCERGERVELGYMQGLTSLTQTENSDDVKFFTRLIPLGSTRNIDRSRYGFSRLQLPDRAKYVDRNTDYGLYEHVEEDAFAGIFPHYTGTVSSVRSQEKTGNDGKPFTVYYFKDEGMEFDPCDYEIAGLVKQLSFQSGELNGRDFEANYHSESGEWEIINIYPDEDTQLPGGNLIPHAGDKYIPWNFRMPAEYEVQAEKNYAAAVNTFLEKYSEDVAKYGGDTDYIYIDKNTVPLLLGQSVRLLSEEYFPTTGYRDTRMTKVVRKLDNLNIATIECTNQVGKGWKQNINDNLSNLQYIVGEKLNQAVIDVLKTWDAREPSEYNVMSSLRSRAEFLSKKYPDAAPWLITFLSGLHIGQYTPGTLGSGGAITVDPKTGHTRMEIDEGYFRKKATFNTLEVMHVTHRGGEDLYTPAGMVCTGVEEFDDFYRCYMNTDDGTKAVVNKFVVNDQVQCKDFNIKPGVYGNVSNQYYWRLVIGVGEDYIDLSKTDCDIGSMIPLSGDKIAQLGNRTDPYRQNAIIISAVAADSPSIKQYAYIDSYSLVDKEVSVTSPQGNKYVGDFFLKTGVNIATQLQVLENLIMTEIQSVEYTLNEKDNHLYNAAFTKDMEGWNPDESIEVYTNEDLIVANDGLLADADKIAEVMPYEGKLWLHLKNSSVIQPNGNITPPVQPGRYYVSLRYICTGSGTISCGFKDTEMFHTASVALTRNTRILEFTGIWDGTGDFLIRFTGDIYINLVSLTNRPLDDYKLEVSSKLKQLSDSISAVVKSVSTLDKTIKESGWLTTADGSKIWASCVFPDGTKAISLFDVTPEGIFLSGSHLNLKGAVTFESFSDNLVEILDQAFNSSELSAKSDVARQLGFSGYNDLVTNAAHGKSILVGGYLNLELIDVDMLVSEKILTDKLKAVTIETEKLVANKGCKIGNLTITDNGAQAGGNAVFEDVGYTWNPVVGLGQASIAAQVRKTIINQIGKSTTILLNMNSGESNYTYIIDLPTRDELDSQGISSDYGFRMTLLVTSSYFMPFLGSTFPTFDLNPTFRISSRPRKKININLQEQEWPDGEIHDNNDNRMEYIDIAKGDVLELYYHSGVYYRINHRN